MAHPQSSFPPQDAPRCLRSGLPDHISAAIFLGRHELPGILWDGPAANSGPRKRGGAVDPGLRRTGGGRLHMAPGQPAPAAPSHTGSGHPALPCPPPGPHPAARLRPPGHRHSLLCLRHPAAVSAPAWGLGRSFCKCCSPGPMGRCDVRP